MKKYEELCDGKSIDELKAEYKHRIKDLGDIKDTGLIDYIHGLIQTKRSNGEPETYNIKFVGIDWWHRPGYKVEGLNVYLGDVNKLWANSDVPKGSTLKETVDAYYKKNLDDLVIFGSTFDEDHDPIGTNVKKNIKLNII